MRVITRIVTDWQGRVLELDSCDWNGPVAFAKGYAAEKANAVTGQNQSSAAQGMARNAYGTLAPFFGNEINAPTGIGQLGINQLTTAGGEATAAELGAGREAATLRASRMGNPSSTASIIDAITRAGMQRQSGNALNANMADLETKLRQQQEGAAGMGALGSDESRAALGYLGLSNTAANDVAKQQQAALNGILQPIAGVAGAGLGAIGQMGAAGEL